MAIIWRIESEEGKGLYVGGFYHHVGVDFLDASQSIATHPNAMYDQALGYYDLRDHNSYKFGFATLAQMRQWIYRPKWLRKMAELGLRLNKYRVPDEYIRRSNYQAIFHRDHATLLESRSPDHGLKPLKGNKSQVTSDAND